MDLKRIDAAIASYKKSMADNDAARLDFFRGLWEIQEQQASLVAGHSGYEAPSLNQAETWYWQGVSFFSQAPVTIKEESFLETLNRIAAYVVENADLEEKTAEALRGYDWSIFVQGSDLELAGSDPASFLQLACADYEASGDEMPVETFVLIVGLSLRPLLQVAARTVMDMLDLKEGQTVHDKPLHCPACGSMATASFVGDTPSNSGRGRMLYCEYCGTEWEFERVRCACCGTHDQSKLHYFHLEGDDAHRLHNCEACGDYMRTVFRDDSAEAFSFEVEDVVMTRLDMVANDSRFSV